MAFDPKRYFVLYAIGFLLLMLFAAVGCKTKPLPSIAHNHNEDSIRTEYRIDSIYVDRYHTIWKQGDTIYIHDSIDRWRTRHDSIYAYKYINTTDTIYQKVEVEKDGAAFWKGSGIAFWILIGIIVLGIAIGLIIKFAK